MPLRMRSVTAGDLSIVALVEAVLYGCLCSHLAVFFCSRSKRDSWPLRSLMLILWILNTGHLIMKGYQVRGVANMGYAFPPSTYFLTLRIGIGCTASTTFLVRSFYISRLWMLSNSKRFVIIPASCNIIFLGAAIAGMIIFQPNYSPHAMRTVFILYIIALALSVFADLAITFGLLYYLWVRRSPTSSNKSFFRRLTIGILNVGLLTTMFTTSILVVVTTTRTPEPGGILESLLGNVFTIALVLTLNYRPRYGSGNTYSTGHIFTTHIDLRIPVHHPASGLEMKEIVEVNNVV